MFHMPSGFAGGKTADMEEQAGFFQNYFKDLLKKITTNVLTEESIMIWLMVDEISLYHITI